jgi:hypothetical protein
VDEHSASADSVSSVLGMGTKTVAKMIDGASEVDPDTHEERVYVNKMFWKGTLNCSKTCVSIGGNDRIEMIRNSTTSNSLQMAFKMHTYIAVWEHMESFESFSILLIMIFCFLR